MIQLLFIVIYYYKKLIMIYYNNIIYTVYKYSLRWIIISTNMFQ